MTITLPLNLGSAGVSPGENTQHLDSIGSDGLTLVSGFDVHSGLSIAPFDEAADQARLDSLNTTATAQGYTFKTATTANFSKLHLVAGETLTLSFDFRPGDDYFNDFAWQIIGKATADSSASLLANVQQVIDNGGNSHFTSTTTINQTGDYDLLIGVSDLGDNQQPSTLVLHSITVTIPDNIYTATPTDIRLSDGSKVLPNGSLVLPSGLAETGVISAGGQSLLSYLLANDAGGSILSHNGANVISNDGGSILSHNGANVISNDGGSILSHNGANVISNDGGSILSHNGANVISNDGGSILSHNGANVISNDGGSILSHNGANFHISEYEDVRPADNDVGNGSGTPTLQAVKIGPEIIASAPASDNLPTQQFSPKIAALSSGKFVATWFDNLNQATGTQEVREQLFNADGTKSGASMVVSTDTAFDQQQPTVTGLSGGRYVVGWSDKLANASGTDSQSDIHLQLFTSTGSKEGGEFSAGVTPGNENELTVASLSTGGFVAAWRGADSGLNGVNSSSGQQFAADGTVVGSGFGLGSTAYLTYKDSPAAAGLHDGGFAVAYRENNIYADDEDGIYLDIFSANGAKTHQEIHVDTTADASQVNPAIATLLNGDLAVVWVDQSIVTSSHPLAAVRAQIFHPDGTRVGSELTIATATPQYDTPTVAALSDGRFVVSYGEATSSGPYTTSLDLKAQLFNADGTTSGDVFTVNVPDEANSFFEHAPSATALADGNFVIAGERGDGQASEIRVQLFGLGAASSPSSGDNSSADPLGGNSAQQSSSETGTHDTNFTDVFGNTIVDTTDAENRLLKEVITGPDGHILTATTLNYDVDGTYHQHTDALTTAGSVSIDASYGVLGALHEMIYVGGQLAGTAMFSYGADGSVVQDTVLAGQTGSDHLVLGKDGQALEYTHTDADGHVSLIFGSDPSRDSQTFAPNKPLFGTTGHDIGNAGVEVFALYSALLGRNPDAPGLEDHAHELQSGLSLSDLAQIFLRSAEGLTHLNAAGNADFVEQLYETAFHRMGDSSGVQHWVDALDHGESRADVALSFTFSDEKLVGLKSSIDAGIFVPDHDSSDAARLYYGVLGRTPEAAGLQSWTQAGKQGETLHDIAQSFLNSTEFQGKSAQNDSQFVENLYSNALGRHSDPDGFNHWTDALQHGESRADVAIGITESSEARYHLASVIENGWHLS